MASAPRADYTANVWEPCTSSRWITTFKYTMLLNPTPQVRIAAYEEEAYDRGLEHHSTHFRMGLGCTVQVRQPPELSDAIHRLAKGISQTMKNTPRSRILELGVRASGDRLPITRYTG